MGHGDGKAKQSLVPSTQLQQGCTEGKLLHQADERGVKRHRFVTARPPRRRAVCELARAAERENTFLSQQPFYTITPVSVDMIAAAGGHPLRCCGGCGARGGSRGLICSWKEVARPGVRETTAWERGARRAAQRFVLPHPAPRPRHPETTLPWAAQGLPGWGSAGNDHHTAAPPAPAERRGRAAMPELCIPKPSPDRLGRSSGAN